MKASLLSCWYLAACSVLPVSSGGVDSADLKRAHQWTPRANYRGRGSLAAANDRLNAHLRARYDSEYRACEEFAVGGLRDLLVALLSYVSDELTTLYSEADGRRARFPSLQDLEADWILAPSSDSIVRDAHCHEVVMWFVHHLPSAKQSEFAKLFTLPLLPIADHTRERPAGDRGQAFYDAKVTCQDCHVGGLDWIDIPEAAPATARERSRRCYTNYKEMFGIECGPCDGIGGIATGEDDEFYQQTECHVVAFPDEVAEDDRVKPAFPSMFSVELVGTNDHFKDLAAPANTPRLYSFSHGMLHMDVRLDSDLWHYRQDVTYTSIMQDGVTLPGYNGSTILTVQKQSAAQRAQNISGPMVEVDKGMPSWKPDGCSCQTNSVGVPRNPDLENMQYLGRIRLPELEFVGGSIELDHWANWFFHFFMDTNTSILHYAEAPSRIMDSLSGPVNTGFTVYGNWTIGDPAIADPSIWHRGIPQKCFNVDGSSMCDNISPTTSLPDTVTSIV